MHSYTDNPDPTDSHPIRVEIEREYNPDLDKARIAREAKEIAGTYPLSCPWCHCVVDVHNPDYVTDALGRRFCSTLHRRNYKAHHPQEYAK